MVHVDTPPDAQLFTFKQSPIATSHDHYLQALILSRAYLMESDQASLRKGSIGVVSFDLG